MTRRPAFPRRALLQMPALLALPGVAAAQGVTGEEIVIGALGALNGATAFIGGPGRDGLQLGINAINAAGGINGRRIRMIYEHAFSPAESVAAAKKLVESDRVLALVLASGSTGAAAAADYVREVGVPTYNIFGSTPIIRTPFAANVFHGAIPDAGVTGRAMVELALGSGTPRRLGILAGTYAFPQSNLAAVEAVLKARGTTYTLQSFDQNAREFTSQLLAFARARVQAVLVLGSFSEAGFAIKQAPEKGLVNVSWVVDGSATNPAILPIIGGTTTDVTGYFNAKYFPDQPEAAAWLKLWRDAYGEPPQGRPNVYDQVGYGSAYVLALAMKAAGRALDWKSLIAAWTELKGAVPSQLGGVDITFPESFTPTDHQGNKAVARAIIRNGAWATAA